MQEAVGHQVRQLIAMGAVGEQAGKGPDDGMNGLTAQGRQAVDQRHPKTEPRRFQGGADSRDSRPHHRQVDRDLAGGRTGFSAHHPGAQMGCRLCHLDLLFLN
jgi:hypothetical protein